MSDFELLVVGAANRKYEHFILPYAVSSLISNPDSAVEVVAEAGFEDRYQKGIDHLNELFPGRSGFPAGDFTGNPSCARFLHNPERQASYAYIGDIDVLMLIPVMATHMEIAEKSGVPYSNIVREREWERGLKCLTGCHFTHFSAYYPVSPPQGFDMSDTSHGVDERLLYAIVAEKLGDPPRGGKYRPLQGFHLSPNGLPFKSWGVLMNKWRSAYKRLREDVRWKEALSFFDPRYRAILALLDASIEIYDAFGQEEMMRYKPFAALALPRPKP